MEIKPCPFCGGKARLIIKYSEKTESYFMRVKCYRCNAQSATYSDEAMPTDDSESKKSAIEAWNKRYTPDS